MEDLFIGATKDIGSLVPLHNFDTEPQVVGVYTKKVEKAGIHETPMYNFKKEDGTEFALWGSYQIKNFMDKHEIGTKVGFKYIGNTELENGNTVKNFECYAW